MSSYRESLRVKMPEQDVADENIGVVLLNHVGGSSRQDTGRDAQMLANQFQTMTIAADRPTSYRLPRRKPLAAGLHAAPVKEMLGLAAKIDRIFSNSGVGKVIIAGRSAGALGALEIAQTEGIGNTSFVYAAEPVGCEDMTLAEGKRRFKQYAETQKALFAEDAERTEPRLIHPVNDAADLPLLARASRLITMAPLFMTDSYYNGEHWNQGLVPGYLAQLAIDQRVQTHVDFAEHSLGLPIDTDAYNAFVNDVYAVAGEADGTLSMSIQQGTTHASFDNRQYFAQRLQTTAALQANIAFKGAA